MTKRDLWLALHRVWMANLARPAFTRREWIQKAMEVAMDEDDFSPYTLPQAFDVESCTCGHPPERHGMSRLDGEPTCFEDGCECRAGWAQFVPRETEDPDALG